MTAPVLAVVEHRRGELREVSLELISAGADLAADAGCELHVAVVGGDAESLADRLDREGVAELHVVPAGQAYNHDVHVQAVAALAGVLEPLAVVGPHTVNGIDWVPALAERLDLPLVTDVLDLAWDDGVLATRTCYGGKVETRLRVDGPRAVVTVRPGEWPAATGVDEVPRSVFEPNVDASTVRSTVTGFVDVTARDRDLAEAEFVIAVGRGVGSASNLDPIEELAAATGGVIAGSGPVVDEGWLPEERRIGQSGTTVEPRVYLALGISGAVQHVTGMRDAETIVAVNTDPDAPIFDVADYGIVGDVFDVVPALLEALDGDAT